MASSGDYSFNPSTYQIITGALRLLGAIQSGEAPPAEEYEDALASLNGLIHAWQTNGLHVWTQSTIDVPLVAGQTSYQIGIGSTDLPLVPRPLKVTEGRLVVGAGETPLIAMSRWDYANLSNKTTPPGPPAQYFYDPQLPYGSLTVYPTPAATGLVRIVAQRPLQSFDTQRDTADIPQEWVSALRFSLAVELGPEYDTPAERLKILKELADEKLKVVQGWDTEPQGTTTLPFSQAVYQLIAGALRLCGGCGAQETPTLGLINNGFYALNALVQAWQASGLHVWAQEAISFPTVIGKALYTIGTSGDVATVTRPLRVTAARSVIGTSVAPMIPMSRWDVANLSPQSGPPTQYFYDPKQPPLGALTLYPTPSTAVTVTLTAQRQLTTFADLTSTADFPDEWLSALRYALAVELWPEHTERRAAVLKSPQFMSLQELKALADEKLKMATAWDVETQGTTTLPFSQSVYQMIAGALRLAGGCGSQDTPSLGLINNGFYALNSMVQSWQGLGIHLWTERDAILFLQPGQRVYRIGVGSPDHCCASNAWRQTYLTSVAVAGATTLAVNATTGILAGDHIAVVLDEQPFQPARYFWTIVSTIGSGTVTLASALPSQASGGARVISYTNDLPRPLKAPAARRIVYAGNLGIPTKIETPLTVYSRIDYSFQTNKDEPGEVTGFFFDPQLGFAELSTWPTAGNVNQALQFTAQLPLTTFADLTTADNFPVEWNNALRYCLAVEIWPEHAERRATVKGDYTIQLVKSLADEKLMNARAWDREPESVYFGVQSYSDTRNT